MKNSQDIKKTVATNNGQAITLLEGKNQQGKLTMFTRKVKKLICGHKVTRGVTLVTSTNKKVVRCVDCSALLERDSIQGGN